MNTNSWIIDFNMLDMYDNLSPGYIYTNNHVLYLYVYIYIYYTCIDYSMSISFVHYHYILDPASGTAASCPRVAQT